jgi:hypothetical protein
VLIRKISVFLHATFHTQDRCPQYEKTILNLNNLSFDFLPRERLEDKSLR